jgi:DNA-binding beta-propeller fold protein YncE
MEVTRRSTLAAGAAFGVWSSLSRGWAQQPQARSSDRVFICNEDSNTLAVIDPERNVVAETMNLTSFDEDPRPPFRFVTGGVMPTHVAMVRKPLYHGAIDIHGAAPSPDDTMIATTGRGTSNVYLIDTSALRVIGNTPNPQAGQTTNPERLTSGIIVGREPHEPTFSRNGRELWVTVRGEDRIAIIDVELARRASAGERVPAVREYLQTINGPAQAWFSKDGALVFVVSQKAPQLDVFETGFDREGRSHPKRLKTIDIRSQDPRAFTPFLKTSPDGGEVWLSHKLADAVSVWSTTADPKPLDTVSLGENARPNHVEFVENSRGKAVYVSFARVDDNGPGNVASSRIGIVDRSAEPGGRKVVGQFFSQGREAHGLWTNPDGTRIYIAHEQDELPNTPNGGQTVCSVFDVSDPFKPQFITQIALGDLTLPSGKLRNKKSINLVYVRPGTRGQAG